MHRRCLIATIAATAFGPLLRPAKAQTRVTTPEAFRFDSIDGGSYDMSDWRGQPALVVNTASLCGFTGQYDELQALHEEYGPRGLVVLAVPSNDFRQELASDDAVAEFCEVNFNLTLPMATITPVRGAAAHPFYRWLSDAYGYVPTWNFNKVLLDGEGRVVGTYGATTQPGSARIRREIEARLPG
jgi:glutathione peroxidase